MEEPICQHYRRAAEIVGRRWVPEIVRVLLDGCARYGQLRSAIPGISDHLLSDRLKSLEADGLVVRKVVPSTPIRVEYTLTEKGADLAGAIGALAAWAERWARADDRVPAPVDR
ncbi:MAG TPA: helix-turn-helix domain-containing protein [Actinomycetota bacterium]|nr:helix-turn-helix domain-containing protein [Actinomycetota bacterium]